MLCGLSIVAPLVVPPPQPRGYSPPAPSSLSSDAVVSPGSRRCWKVAAPLWLAGSSGVQRSSSWTSAGTSPPASSVGLISGSPARSLQTQVCLFGRCCSLWCFPLRADWQAPFILYLDFCPSLLSVLGYGRYINQIYCYYYCCRKCVEHPNHHVKLFVSSCHRLILYQSNCEITFNILFCPCLRHEIVCVGV